LKRAQQIRRLQRRGINLGTAWIVVGVVAIKNSSEDAGDRSTDSLLPSGCDGVGNAFGKSNERRHDIIYGHPQTPHLTCELIDGKSSARQIGKSKPGTVEILGGC